MKRDTTAITLCIVFTLVMLTTGALVIDLYNRSPADVRADTGFHWGAGLLSICGGLVSMVVGVLLLVYPSKMGGIKDAMKS